MDKEKLKEKAEKCYLGRESRVPQRVIDWAIGEGEVMHFDYLLERERRNTKEGEVKVPHEKHRLVTEKRVLDLKFYPNEAGYRTKFLIKNIENITQGFSVERNKLLGDKLEPEYSIQVHLKKREEPIKLESRSTSSSNDKEEFKEFISTLTKLRFGN